MAHNVTIWSAQALMLKNDWSTALAWGINESKWVLELNISGAFYTNQVFATTFLSYPVFSEHHFPHLSSFLLSPAHSPLSSSPSSEFVFLLINLQQEKKATSCHKPGTSLLYSFNGQNVLWTSSLEHRLPTPKFSRERFHSCSVVTHVLRTCQ